MALLGSITINLTLLPWEEKMKNNRIGLVLLTLLAATALIAVDVAANKPLLLQSFDVTFRPESYISGPGVHRFVLSVSPNERGEKYYSPDRMVTVTLEPRLTLSTTSDRVFELKLPVEGAIERDISLNIPPNDTCGLKIMLQCGSAVQPHFAYFVTFEDSIEFHRGDPRGRRSLYPIGIIGADTGFYSEEELLQYRADQRKLKEDSAKNEQPRSNPKIQQFTKREAEEHKRWKLEQSTLKGKFSETIFIGDSAYIRFEGDSLFQPYEKGMYIPGKKEAIARDHKRMMDSLKAIPPDTEYEVCLILDTEEKLQFARKRLGILNVTKDPHHFHNTVTKADLQAMNKLGISVIYLDLHPHTHPGTGEIELTPDTSTQDSYLPPPLNKIAKAPWNSSGPAICWPQTGKTTGLRLITNPITVSTTGDLPPLTTTLSGVPLTEI